MQDASFHLAADDAGQDFRAEGALSTSAPSAHTPGPWFPTKDSLWNEVARVGRAWNIGTKLALSHMGHPDADARLLAAAPDLLEALTAIVASLAEHDDEGMVEHAAQMVAARAAIAKATGEQA